MTGKSLRHTIRKHRLRSVGWQELEPPNAHVTAYDWQVSRHVIPSFYQVFKAPKTTKAHPIEMACLPALCTSATSQTKLVTWPWSHIHGTSPVDGRHFRGASNAWAVLVPLNLAYRSRPVVPRCVRAVGGVVLPKFF